MLGLILGDPDELPEGLVDSVEESDPLPLPLAVPVLEAEMLCVPVALTVVVFDTVPEIDADPDAVLSADAVGDPVEVLEGLIVRVLVGAPDLEALILPLPLSVTEGVTEPLLDKLRVLVILSDALALKELWAELV